MSEKTIQGKSCPACASFVESGASRCGVCGHPMNPPSKNREPEVTQNLESRIAEENGADDEALTCSRCGSDNDADARFCKICKHPFTQVYRHRDTPATGIDFLWSTIPPGVPIQRTLKLEPMTEAGASYGVAWHYLFMAAGSPTNWTLVIQRVVQERVRLFKILESPFLLVPGSTFYLGAVGFKIMGGRSSGTGSGKSASRQDATVLKGPGDQKAANHMEGPSRLFMESEDGELPAVPIEEAKTLGRASLCAMFGISEQILQEQGVSEHHISLTPLPDGLWLLEPAEGKRVYLEIGDRPEVVTRSDTLRWLEHDRSGELMAQPRWETA